MGIEVFRDTGQAKADWLFEGIDPSDQEKKRRWENSESWWTTVFSLLLLHLAKQDHPKIPLRKLKRQDESSTSFEPAGVLGCHGLTYWDLAIEARLKTIVPHWLEIPNWPSELGSLTPDIAFYQKRKKRLVLIEVKTVRAWGSDWKKYLAACKRLRDEKPDWDIKMVVLISLGNSKAPIWNAIEANREEFHVILWEDVLKIIDNNKVFKSIFGVSLRDYYKDVKACTA